MIEGPETMTLESKSIGELDRSHRLVSMSIRLSERVVGNGRTRALGRCCGGGGRNSPWHWHVEVARVRVYFDFT